MAGMMASEVRALLRVALRESASCRFKLPAEDVVRPHGGAGGTANCSYRWGIAALCFKTVVIQPVVPETLLGLRR
jgi:hypothetical protein